MDINIQVEESNDEVIKFLVYESFMLFVRLYKIDKDNCLSLRIVKNDLLRSYEEDMVNFKIYTARENGHLVGVATINKQNYLQDLFVKEEYQGKGIGSSLLKKIIEDNKEYGDIICDANPEYLDFYKKHSFSVIREEEISIKVKRSF